MPTVRSEINSIYKSNQQGVGKSDAFSVILFKYE